MEGKREGNEKVTADPYTAYIHLPIFLCQGQVWENQMCIQNWNATEFDKLKKAVEIWKAIITKNEPKSSEDDRKIEDL